VVKTVQSSAVYEEEILGKILEKVLQSGEDHKKEAQDVKGLDAEEY
jgi:hypothetical protein